jgi:hypothetical protein
VYIIDNLLFPAVGYLIYKDSNMSKIIQLNKRFQKLTTDVYTAAAWNFALIALWPFEKYSKSKARTCQSYIKRYLLSTPDIQTSFITFCEKVLLINRTLSITNPYIIDPPIIWLNPDFKAGYTSTDELHILIRKKRDVPAHYLEGITCLAKGYWDFINQPTPSILLKVHDRLLYLRQYDLKSLLGQVTLKYILVSKQLI